MFVNESQIRALIRLLGDEDERIVKTISGKLIDFGDSAVPLLQEAEIEQPEMADRIVTVLEEIRFPMILTHAFKSCRTNESIAQL